MSAKLLFEVNWDTGKKKGSNNLLTEENLGKVGISSTSIKEIQPFFAFSRTLYTETGVARSSHPCCGSVGINIITTYDKNVSIQELFYHDQGHKKGSLAGVPHWNREKRYVDINGKETRVKSNEDHVLEDSESIMISFKDSDGVEQKQEVKKDYSNISDN